MDNRLFFRYLDPLNLFQFFNAALHLLCFSRLRPEPVDESLKMLYLDALVSIRRL